MWIYYFFAFIVVLQGIASLRGGFSFLRYVRREMSRESSDFAPFTTIVAPCRGLDQGLRENLAALFDQDYPSYEILFVTDSAQDKAVDVIEEVRREHKAQTRVNSRIVIAGEASDCGQKVHNLRVAVADADSRSAVVVFVDSDARPHSGWLRSLVAPLGDERLGAATGYRWFIPSSRSFGSSLRAVWNASIASALGDRGDKNFCWGGATAIRRTTFEKLKMSERWRGTASDDFALTRALQTANLAIHFVPACLTPSLDNCGVRETLEFTTRQLKITRVYASHLWKAVLIGSLLFVSVFFGGLAIVIVRAFLGMSWLLPLSLLILIFVLGSLKAYVRLLAVNFAISQHAPEVRKGKLAHLTLWPIASALYLYNATCAAFSRRIQWRGITYELKSPTETVIMRE
jgi:cellulose synthase/poly-beta-1,6-N-acetylglucosamine synthase-like glycosyltransferase